MMKKLTCHTGGASGADIYFEMICVKNKVNVVAYSFDEHRTISRFKKMLNTSELIEGWDKVQIAAKEMGRNTYGMHGYVKKLLARDWFQVKFSDAVFAIGNILQPKEKGVRTTNNKNFPIVDGGTGYACMLAIQHNKPVYVFNQKDDKWYMWENRLGLPGTFKEMKEKPVLTENFAGVGSRNLTKSGEKAIESLF